MHTYTYTYNRHKAIHAYIRTCIHVHTCTCIHTLRTFKSLIIITYIHAYIHTNIYTCIHTLDTGIQSGCYFQPYQMKGDIQANMSCLMSMVAPWNMSSSQQNVWAWDWHLDHKHNNQCSSRKGFPKLSIQANDCKCSLQTKCNDMTLRHYALSWYIFLHLSNLIILRDALKKLWHQIFHCSPYKRH